MFNLAGKYDAAIVGRVLAGERDKFGLLVGKYLGFVQAIARGQLGLRGDVEVVAQETFLAAYRSLNMLWQLPIAGPHGDIGEGLAFAPDGTIYLAARGLEGKAALMAVK